MSMNTHTLKTINPYFEELWIGAKKFEVRKDDRSFQVGDTLILREYDPTNDTYSGRVINAEVTYKLAGGQFGIKEGYCVLSIDHDY